MNAVESLLVRDRNQIAADAGLEPKVLRLKAKRLVLSDTLE